MKITLLRIEETEKETLGIILINGEATNFKSIELPYRCNQPNISSIPVGAYTIFQVLSPKHSYCYELLNVKNRTDIQIHVANKASELLGCIALGYEYGTLDNERAVLYSRRAIEDFNGILNKVKFDDKITLDIKSCVCCI